MENLENLAKDPREESSQVRSPTSIQFSFKSVLDSCRDTCYNFSIEGREGEGAPPPRHISARLSLTASILLSVHSLAYSLAGKCNNSKPTGGGVGGARYTGGYRFPATWENLVFSLLTGLDPPVVYRRFRATPNVISSSMLLLQRRRNRSPINSHRRMRQSNVRRAFRV